MRLTVVGCSGSFPGPDSPASCYLIEAEHEGRPYRLLLDLGNGSLGALQNHAELASIDAVALSHLHPDHCLDMCGFYVARKYHPDGPMPVIPVLGPHGAARYLAGAYGIVEPEGMTGEFDFKVWSAGETQRLGPFEIECFEVDHPIEAYSIKVRAAGRTLVYSGDTGPFDALTDFVHGADVFLSEASFREGEDNPPNIHLTGADAGRIARDARVGRLLLTHIPPWHQRSVALAEAAGVFDGEMALAEPGRTYEL